MSTTRLGPPLRSVIHSISPATVAANVPRGWRAVPSRSLDLRSAYGPGSSGAGPVRIRQAVRDDSGVEITKEESAVAEVVKQEAKGKEPAARPEDKVRTVQGVEIPAKPTPPGPEECCMGGACPKPHKTVESDADGQDARFASTTCTPTL